MNFIIAISLLAALALVSVLAYLESLAGQAAADRRSRLVGRDPKSLRGVGRRDLFDCAPPIMAGFEPQTAFSF